MLGLSKTNKGSVSIFEVVERFSKMAHLIPCKKKHYATNMVVLFFKYIRRFHGLSRNITPNRDSEFIGNFWRTLWKKLGIKLQFSSRYHPQMNRETKVENGSLGNLLTFFVGYKEVQMEYNLCMSIIVL